MGGGIKWVQSILNNFGYGKCLTFIQVNNSKETVEARRSCSRLE